MSKTKSTTRTTGVEFTVSSVSISDAGSVAEAAVASAVDYAVDKTGLEHETVIDHLKWGNCTTYGYFQYGLAKQMAEHLSKLDEDISAVYVWDENTCEEDAPFTAIPQPSPLHLIVQAGRKTSALESLAAALDRALLESYKKLIGPCELEHILDAQIVDADDIKNRMGYGALLASLYHRPIQIWQR